MQKKRQQGLEFGITRIGVNSGPAVVGNFGGSSRFDYTAHGDAINTAARLESVNRYFGTRICVSGTTARHCPAHFFRPIGELILKGKTEAIETYEPVSEEESHSPRVERYRAAYGYLKKEHPDAGRMFSELLQAYPDDSLVQYHANRISQGETGTVIAFDKK